MMLRDCRCVPPCIPLPEERWQASVSAVLQPSRCCCWGKDAALFGFLMLSLLLLCLSFFPSSVLAFIYLLLRFRCFFPPVVLCQPVPRFCLWGKDAALFDF